MKTWKVIYTAVGFLLAVGSIATASYGLSEVNRNIYQDALYLDEKIQELGFDGFSLKTTKVRFYDGSNDYVVQVDAEGHITIKKERPQMDVFAGTTVEAAGQWQALLPTYEQFSRLFDALEALGSYEQGMQEGNFAFSKSDYGESSHAATIWHEAFHAWQSENWPEDMEALMEKAGIGKEDSREEIIVKEVDSDKELVELFNEEMQLLMKAYRAEGPEEKRALIADVLKIAEKRKEKLSQAAEAMEYFLENYEGSARYVESIAYRELEGESAWETIYLSEFRYENGSGKYYDMGMMKCLLLDQLSDGWQKKFSPENGLNELLSRM
ncbi:MAG: hypothetical protein K2J60_05840 [Acetatifactor sp.]|nr:hypothetical protein [Acetatifactor sp.]